MYRTDDPCDDARRHMDEQERELSRLPVCACCGYPIQSERLFEFDGDLFCPECVNEHHKKWTSEYIN